MNQTNLCLSDDDLYRLQRNEVSQDDVATMEAHVNQCSRCTEILDSIHKDTQWIADIHPVLQETYKDLPTSSDVSGDSAHESVLNLLSPSEDPAMLGRVGTCCRFLASINGKALRIW